MFLLLLFLLDVPFQVSSTTRTASEARQLLHLVRSNFNSRYIVMPLEHIQKKILIILSFTCTLVMHSFEHSVVLNVWFDTLKWELFACLTNTKQQVFFFKFRFLSQFSVLELHSATLQYEIEKQILPSTWEWGPARVVLIQESCPYWGIQGGWIKLIVTTINYGLQHKQHTNAMVNQMFQKQEPGGDESAVKQVRWVGQPLPLPEHLSRNCTSYPSFQCELWTSHHTTSLWKAFFFWESP